MKTRPLPTALLTPACLSCQARVPLKARGLCPDCHDDGQQERHLADGESTFNLQQQAFARTPAEQDRLRREAATWLRRRDELDQVGR